MSARSIADRAVNEPHVFVARGMGAEDYCAICDRVKVDKRHVQPRAVEGRTAA